MICFVKDVMRSVVMRSVVLRRNYNKFIR